MYTYYKTSCRRTLRRYFSSPYFDRTYYFQNDGDRPVAETAHYRSCVLILLIPIIFLFLEVSYPVEVEHISKETQPFQSTKSIDSGIIFKGKRILVPKKVSKEYFIPLKNFTTASKRKRYERVANSLPVENKKEKYYTYNDIIENNTNLKSCAINSTNLPAFKLNMSKVLSLVDVYPMVQKGGYYKPKDCFSKDRVAILVPYRNRTKSLSTFLFNIHPILMAQKLEYRIFVIEQYGKSAFNKGRLINVGFIEMKKYGWWHCVVLHDVDLLPLSPRILYSCPRLPRHMSTRVFNLDSRNRKSQAIVFGGVISIMFNHFQKTNGYSNAYWGIGGVDYDFFRRIRAAELPLLRYNRTVGIYVGMAHVRTTTVRDLRNPLVTQALARWTDDGLNSARYHLKSVTLGNLFTHIIVDIDGFQDTSKTKNNLVLGAKFLSEI